MSLENNPAVGIFNTLWPKGAGPATCSFTVDFSVGVSFTLDMTVQQQKNNLPFVQSVFIDNSKNPSPVSVFSQGTNQTLICAPFSQGYFPILSQNPPVYTVASAGGVVVNFNFMDVPVVGEQWNVLNAAVAPVVPGAAVKASPIGAMTSRSTVTVATTSTVLFPANAARKYMTYQMPQTAGCWLNLLGGTAGPNLADCFFCVAGEKYESGIMAISNAITYYCATASLEISAMEA